VGGPGHELSYPILAVLSLVLVLQLQGHANFAIMTATERNTFLVKAALVGAPANVILSVLFTRIWGPYWTCSWFSGYRISYGCHLTSYSHLSRIRFLLSPLYEQYFYFCLAYVVTIAFAL
jgi:hypothetical protein